MTNKILRARSLSLKMLYVTLLGLFLGAVVYMLVLAAGRQYIELVYKSQENITQRKAEIYSEFSEYVQQRSISGMDTSAVARWTAQHEYVDILIYDSANLHRSFSKGQEQPLPERKEYDAELYGRLYPLRFSDGIYLIAIADSSENQVMFIVLGLAVASAALSFIFLLLWYTNRLTKRIIELSRAAAVVSSGQLENIIAMEGSDEISALARAMDEMRLSVIEQMGSENRAWQANSELITAISHDIRTPMTSMIGYLGLLNESDFQDKERCGQFCRSAYQKAMELKYLTDELFKYFLAFGSAELEMQQESYDGRLLLQQLCGEAEFTLAEKGFAVEQTEFQGECSVVTDPLYLKRVVDNLVSNILKYGDKDSPVTIISRLKDGRLSLCFSNGIKTSFERVESTRIGLRSCKRIMEHMGGSFETESDEEHFAAELSLPAEEN